LYGKESGFKMNGENNICLGQKTGKYLDGKNNIIIGCTKEYISGDNNILIGSFDVEDDVEDNELGNQLRIGKLVEGNFDDDDDKSLITINGSLKVNRGTHGGQIHIYDKQPAIIGQQEFWAIDNDDNGNLSVSHSGTTSKKVIFNEIESTTIKANDIEATTISFRIEDPTKDDHYRYHSAVATPTAGDNIYRFTVKTVDNTCLILLDEYIQALNENIMIWVSPKKHFGNAYGVVSNNTLEVTSNEDGVYNVLFIGTRKDLQQR
jgi:hypothetical protein